MDGEMLVHVSSQVGSRLWYRVMNQVSSRVQCQIQIQVEVSIESRVNDRVCNSERILHVRNHVWNQIRCETTGKPLIFG